MGSTGSSLQERTYVGVCVAYASCCIMVAQPSSASSPSASAVETWFRNYDQIRRDAEMTRAEKCESFKLLNKGWNSSAQPEEQRSARELAQRMVERYRIAGAAMKKLRPTPKTRALQEGYTQYFLKAEQLFGIFLENDAEVRSLMSSKKALEELDKKNKQLDKLARKENGIPPQEKNS